MRLTKRRTFWVSAAVLLSLVVAWFFGPRSRITQANFNRIHEGMNEAEVVSMLGEPTSTIATKSTVFTNLECLDWIDGPNVISVEFVSHRYRTKSSRFLTPYQTLIWYAKKSAAKIGLNWDDPPPRADISS
jgi:hypothetical protein